MHGFGPPPERPAAVAEDTLAHGLDIARCPGTIRNTTMKPAGQRHWRALANERAENP